MRRFWKQRNEFSQLEGDLRRERPRARPDYVETLATQLRGERVTTSHRPALRYRVAVAVALTGVLGVAAAASGGLTYANAASSQTVRAVAHVFTSQSTSERRAQSSAQSSHDGAATGSRGSTDETGNARRSADEGGSSRGGSKDEDHSRGHDDNRGHDDDAAHHQYVEFVFVCLRVPPRHPFIFITLRLPKVAADALVARGIATPGPC